MNLKQYENGVYATWQRQGSNKMGNPIYIINTFHTMPNGHIYNTNHLYDGKTDKYGNIRITSYNIESTVESILNQIKSKGE